MKIHRHDIRVGNLKVRHGPGSEDYRCFQHGGHEDDYAESDERAEPDRSTRPRATKDEDHDHSHGYRDEESDTLLIREHREGVERARQR